MKLNKRRRAIVIASALTAAEALILRNRRGTLLSAHAIVRCNQGHLFTTIWIPGVSLKAARLGPWRLQRCPIGQHWTIVTPVQVAELSTEERAGAESVRDTRVP